MANELMVGLELRPVPPYQEKIMNWFSPVEKPQLLPKDLLHAAKKFSAEEAEQQILNAVRNLKNSFYSHGTTTYGSPWVNIPLGMGVTMGSATSTAVYSSFAYSGAPLSNNPYYFTTT